MELATAAQMRAMDKAAEHDYGIPGIVLMENAALRVIDIINERYGPLAGQRISVVCGPGGNGGDGLAIARHLETRFGVTVSIWLVSPDKLSADSLTNYHIAQKLGLVMRPVSEMGDQLSHSQLIIDALLGTGMTRAVTGEMAAAIETMNASGVPILSVDAPSGVDTDTGRINGACVRATVTVTFVRAKLGLIDYPGASYAGELVVADIGMPRPLLVSTGTLTTTEAREIAHVLPPRDEGRDINKGTYGTVLCVAGSRGMIGASVLCAEAAARTGAGLVTLAVPQDAQSAAMARVSPVVMTRGLPETPQGTFALGALEMALALAGKAKAAAIGPGLGGTESAETRKFTLEFIRQCPCPLVVDADALNILSLEDDHGTFILKARPAATILTPHPGEMGRLLGISTADVQGNRRSAVLQAAASYHCTVLLKGARTVIAAPDGSLRINTTGNAGMASGGMGDTLTGILGALMALGAPTPDTAAAGAFLHGLAGDMAAESHGGKAGLLATDMINILPRAIAAMQKAGAK